MEAKQSIIASSASCGEDRPPSLSLHSPSPLALCRKGGSGRGRRQRHGNDVLHPLNVSLRTFTLGHQRSFLFLALSWLLIYIDVTLSSSNDAISFQSS
ncbi:chaperone protein dnaJ 2 [Corchorus capsularis]|uniref:Chaperone protein dnaJ 2 n=1 Tax=Corchorus capsularis TaxID=210143 RepID=A0A1R3J4I4_COCAP|nr:chaperone protein dnaJ 2 [Corchorus capsularis]